MEEAIQEFKNIFFIIEARMKAIIERSFPGLQVGLPGLLESWQQNSLQKNGYIPLGSLPEGIVKVLRVLQTTRSLSYKLMETYTFNISSN